MSSQTRENEFSEKTGFPQNLERAARLKQVRTQKNNVLAGYTVQMHMLMFLN